MERLTTPRLHIISHSSEPFADREQAGRLLSRELGEYEGQRAVVLGIPRGGVVVAKALALALSADLDIVLARKLRTPGHGELALGSISERGDVFLNDDVVRSLDVSNDYINQEKAIQIGEIQRRAKLFRAVKTRIPLQGKVVILTDDGIATGATTQAAIRAVQAENPEKFILALPVGSESTLRKLAEEVDLLICLRAPRWFMAVGQFYLHFEPVTDEDVLKILEASNSKTAN